MNRCHSIVYASTAVTPLSDKQLLDLLKTSRENNRRDEITGILLHNKGRFLQCIEGSEAAVKALYATIVRDPRHRDILELVNEPIDQRDFASWTMGFAPIHFQAFNDLLASSWPLREQASFPGTGSKGKQLLQIVWEQMTTLDI